MMVCKQKTELMLNRTKLFQIKWNHFTVCKKKKLKLVLKYHLQDTKKLYLFETELFLAFKLYTCAKLNCLK